MSYTYPMPPVDYTSRDFSSIIADLQSAIPTYMPEWTNTSTLDFGIVLLELFAYIADELNYYIDRVANETFLSTATQRSSVLNIAYMLDYSPQGPMPARATLSLTVAPGSPDFPLLKGTQFSTQTSPSGQPIIFEMEQDHTITADMAGTSITSTEAGDLVVVQGVTVSEEAVGTSSGVIAQSFALFNTPVIEPSVEVYVDEGNGPVPWTYVGDLIDAGPFDAVFSLAIDANGTSYIGFGDGVSGKVPAPMSPITATYRVGGGVAGNVSASQISVDRSGLSYFTGVTNPNAAVGGSDAESIRSIQINAPRMLTAGDRCVSLQDYAAVALSVPGVSKASADAVSPMEVIVYVHPAGGPYQAADLADHVATLTPDLTWGGVGPQDADGKSGYLDSRKMAGVSITIAPPTYDGNVGYVPIVLELNVVAYPSYINVLVEQSVIAALNDLFDFSTFGFQQRLTLSSVYHRVQRVEGVSYLTVSEMHRADAPDNTLGDIICGVSEIPVLGSPDTSDTGITINMSGGM